MRACVLSLPMPPWFILPPGNESKRSSLWIDATSPFIEPVADALFAFCPRWINFDVRIRASLVHYLFHVRTFHFNSIFPQRRFPWQSRVSLSLQRLRPSS